MAVNEQDIARLQRQLEESYRSLRQQHMANSDTLAKWENDFRTLRDNLIRSTRDLQGDLIERYRTLEEDMRRDYALQVKNMKEEYSRQVEEVRELETQFRRMIDELNEEQKKVIAEINRQNTRAFEVAKEQEAKFSHAVNVALQQPTDIFYPHRLQNYIMAGERARSLMDEGLYTLSASDYSNICMAVNELTENTIQKLQEIRTMFGIYSALAARIDLQRAAPYVLRDDSGEEVLSLDDADDIDYWSDSLFWTLSQAVSEHKRNAEAGPEAWLNSHRDSKISPLLLLDREIRRLESIPEQLRICITYALSACDSYNFLFDIREAVLQVMSEQNYTYEGTLFGEKNSMIPDSPGYKHYLQWLSGEKCLIEGHDPDYREERCICFRNPEGNICRLYMIPVRTNSTVAFTLYIESVAEHNPDMVQRALQNMLASRLNMAVNILDDHSNIHSASGRIMTETELRHLAAVPDRDNLTSKYCCNV